MLADGQISVRGLVMGRGTPYKLLSEFNPWERESRVSQEGERPWDNGSWAGVEFVEKATVPIRVVTTGETRLEWMDNHHRLVAAFKARGIAYGEDELAWNFAGREYVMYGRPRMVKPDVKNVMTGISYDACVFVALDPRMYSVEVHTSASLLLPQLVGGLTLPVEAPFIVDAQWVGTNSDATLQTIGLEEAPLTLTIVGPVVQPRVILNRGDGVTQTMNFNITLASYDTMVVDPVKQQVLVSSAFYTDLDYTWSASGEWMSLPAAGNPPSTLIYESASDQNQITTLTASWRDTWIG